MRRTTRPHRTARLQLQALEDRSLPSFGFGSAFAVGSAGADFGFGIALDSSASTYVAGYYNGTVDFDPNATNPSSNHVLTASGTSGANYVAKYLTDGTFQWATDLGPVTGACESVAVQGSSVFVGYLIGTAGNDSYVSKLDATTGAVNWTTDLGSGAQGTTGVAVGPSGSVYATSENAAGQAFVSSLDSTGAVTWTRASSGGSARGVGATVDAAGNVFASGNYSGTVAFGSTTVTSGTGGQDVFAWKLNAAGNSVWAGSMGGNGAATFGGITADGSGNVTVAGEWSGSSKDNNFNPNSGTAVKLTNDGQHDVFIAKLAPGTAGSMNLSWAKDIGGSGDDWEQGLAVDAAGGVYTTGHFDGTVNFNPNSGTRHNLSGGGIFVSKLDANGNYVAAAGMAPGLVLPNYARGRGIAVDGSGNVYSTGTFTSTANFNPNGTYNLTSNCGADAYVSKLTQTSPQLAVSRGPNVGVVPLTQAQLSAAEAAAIRDWAAAGLPAADIARMKAVKADIESLVGNHLGSAELNGTEIAIDATADGWGWSVNPNAKPAAGRMDLVTVVMHELGHTIGLDSRFSGDPSDLMYAYLAPGEGRMPGPADVPSGSEANALLDAAPRSSDEQSIDWLTATSALKPRSNLYAGWLAAGDQS